MSETKMGRVEINKAFSAIALCGACEDDDLDFCSACEALISRVNAAFDALTAERDKWKAARDECERQYQEKVTKVSRLLNERDDLRTQLAEALETRKHIDAAGRLEHARKIEAERQRDLAVEALRKVRALTGGGMRAKHPQNVITGAWRDASDALAQIESTPEAGSAPAGTPNEATSLGRSGDQPAKDCDSSDAVDRPSVHQSQASGWIFGGYDPGPDIYVAPKPARNPTQSVRNSEERSKLNEARREILRPDGILTPEAGRLLREDMRDHSQCATRAEVAELADLLWSVACEVDGAVRINHTDDDNRAATGPEASKAAALRDRLREGKEKP